MREVLLKFGVYTVAARGCGVSILGHLSKAGVCGYRESGFLSPESAFLSSQASSPHSQRLLHADTTKS